MSNPVEKLHDQAAAGLQTILKDQRLINLLILLFGIAAVIVIAAYLLYKRKETKTA